jgi:hypothetical protein
LWDWSSHLTLEWRRHLGDMVERLKDAAISFE